MPKLLIFGIDGASHWLLQQWMGAGLAPNFSKFSRQAELCSPLRCTWPPHTASGWTSLFSGKLPGRHGHFQFWNCQDFNYELTLMKSSDAGCRMLWDCLAEKGWSLGLMNIPMSHPAHEWPGYEITWPLEPTIRFARPPGILREISEVGGLALPDIACMYDGSQNYPTLATSYVQKRTIAVKHMMQYHPTDVVAVVYTELDRICHHYWHTFDQSHPHYATKSSAQGEVVLNVIRALDDAFQELVDMIGDDCIVAVVSDHGFGPGKQGVRIHRWLEEGTFCLCSQADRSANAEAVGKKPSSPALDWNRTIAYMPTPGSFGINLNEKGRQQKGVVDGFDRKRILEDVRRHVLNLMDPVTGESVFSAVLDRQQAYSGPFATGAPDLLVVPRDPSTMILYDSNGPLFGDPGQCGLHRIEGVCMIRGLRQGVSTPMIPIESFAAITLDALGIKDDELSPNSLELDGMVALLGAGLSDASWSSKCDATRFEVVGPSPQAEKAPYLGCDVQDTWSEETNERLRLMGYL